jgi:alpha-L-arabinofuranosidase
MAIAPAPLKPPKNMLVRQLLAALGLAMLPLVHGENLLRNPAFDEALAGGAWNAITWDGEARLTADQSGRSGLAARIASEAGADAAWSQTVSVPPNARLRLSGWIRTRGVQPLDGQGALLNVQEISEARSGVVTGTNDWTRVQVEFDTGVNQSLQINALFGGWGQATGVAWFDDLQLETIASQPVQPKTVRSQITIDPREKLEPISPLIFGQFIEHMGECIYGGIWAEMLEDRKFFHPVPAPGEIRSRTRQGAVVLAASPWKVIGPPERVEMSRADPLSGEHNPRITLNDVPGGVFQEELGLLSGKGYTGRIVVRGDPSAAPIRVSLVWGEGQANRETVTIDRLSESFATYPIRFTAGADSANGRLEIAGHGRGSFTIGTASLMPDDHVSGFRRDTLELLKQLASPIYRWPGGNFVSAYDWRDGLGDRDRRPTRSNPAWTGIEPNDVGMHEFIELCRLLQTEPLITVNTGFGDAYSAAAQLEYANGAADTLMGQWRARNGSPEPFKVRYWCVGNEMWGRWQLGHMSLEHYVQKHNWVEGMMRKTDPNIITVSSGDLGGGWSEGLLRRSSNYMDHIAEHFYTRSRSDLTAHVRQVPDAIRTKANAHREHRTTIPELAGKDIRIAMTEWNYWYGPHVYGELGTRYFMKDALGIAAGLHEYFRNSDIIHSAYYAQTVNVIGAIKTTKTAAEFDATAYPLILYRREFGSQPLKVAGWDEKLDVAAALSEDGRFLTIGVVNATIDHYQVDFNLGGLNAAGPATRWVIAHADPLAHNTPGEPPVIGIGEPDAARIGSTVSIQPSSITLLKVPLR